MEDSSFRYPDSNHVGNFLKLNSPLFSPWHQNSEESRFIVIVSLSPSRMCAHFARYIEVKYFTKLLQK